jgi:hypothetical protein
MNRGKDFLSVKQLMILMGTNCYNSAWKRHKAIREAIKPNKKALTISEYCNFEGYDKQEINKILGIAPI